MSETCDPSPTPPSPTPKRPGMIQPAYKPALVGLVRNGINVLHAFHDLLDDDDSERFQARLKRCLPALKGNLDALTKFAFSGPSRPPRSA